MLPHGARRPTVGRDRHAAFETQRHSSSASSLSAPRGEALEVGWHWREAASSGHIIDVVDVIHTSAPGSRRVISIWRCGGEGEGEEQEEEQEEGRMSEHMITARHFSPARFHGQRLLGVRYSNDSEGPGVDVDVFQKSHWRTITAQRRTAEHENENSDMHDADAIAWPEEEQEDQKPRTRTGGQRGRGGRSECEKTGQTGGCRPAQKEWVCRMRRRRRRMCGTRQERDMRLLLRAMSQATSYNIRTHALRAGRAPPRAWQSQKVQEGKSKWRRRRLSGAALRSAVCGVMRCGAV